MTKDGPTTAVQVALRIRPLTDRDRAQPRFANLSNDDVLKIFEKTVQVVPHNKLFTFDHVFGTNSEQVEIFSAIGDPLIRKFVEGYNVTILAYGQTSSGKTYTMGTAQTGGHSRPDQEGIVPRSMALLFDILHQNDHQQQQNRPISPTSSVSSTTTASNKSRLRPLSRISNTPSSQRRSHIPAVPSSNNNNNNNGNGKTRFTAKVSFIEIYNEELNDLLNSAPEHERPPVTIREDTKGTIYWTGVKEVVVHSTDDVLFHLEQGTQNRATGATDMNEKSSRSHAIFSVSLRQEKFVPSSPERKRPASSMSTRSSTSNAQQRSTSEDGEWIITTSKFHFVDLAGSERLKRTAAEGDRRKEGININAGLLALGNVISALGDPSKKKVHVPYRDSKLTRLLQDSLGGNATTLMIACASPVEYNLAETLNTLQYANRARNIKNRSEKNEVEEWMTTENIELLRNLIAKLKTEVRYLKTNNKHSTAATNTNSKDEDQSISSHDDDDFERYHDQHIVIADLQRQVEELDGEASVTRERNRMVEKELQKLRLMLSKADPKNQDVDFQHLVEPVIEEYEKSISKLESQLAMTRAALNHTDSSFDEQTVKITQLETTIHSQERTINDLRLRLSKILEREQSNDTYIHDLETKLMKSANDATRDQEMLNELKTRIMKLKETDENTEQYIASLEQRLAAGEAERARLQESIEALESKLELKERANMELFKKLARTSTANDGAASTEKLILKELDQVTAKLSLAESERDRFKEKMDQLQKSVDKSDSTAAAAGASPTDPTGTDPKEKKRPTSVGSNASSRSNRKSLADENETATSAAALSLFQSEMRLKEETERANKLQLTLDMLKHDHEETVKELDEVLQRYQEALEQVDLLERDTNDTDMLKSMDLNKEIARAKEETYAREKDDYTQKIEDLENTIQALQTDLSRRPLMEDIELLESSLEELKQEQDQYRQKASFDMMTIEQLEHDLELTHKQISLLKKTKGEDEKHSIPNGIHLDKELKTEKDAAEVENLERKLEFKQTELDKLSSDYNSLKASHEELLKNSVYLDKELISTRDALIEMKNIERQLQFKQAELDQLSNDYNSLKTSQDEEVLVKSFENGGGGGGVALDKELNSAEMESLERKLQLKQTEFDQLSNSYSSLKSSHEKSMRNNVTNGIDLEKSVSIIEQNKIDLDQTMHEYNSLRLAYGELEQKSRLKEQELTNMTNQLNQKQSEFERAQQEFAQIQQQVDRSVEDKAQSASNVKALENQLQEKQLELDRVLLEYKTLKHAQQALGQQEESSSLPEKEEGEEKEEEEKHVVKITALEQQLAEKQVQLDQIKMEHEQLTNLLKTHEQKSKDFVLQERQWLDKHNEFDTIQSEYVALQQTHSTLQEEFKKLSLELEKKNELEEQLQKKQLELDQLRAEHDALLLTHSSQSGEQLNETQSKLDQVQQEHDKLQLIHQAMKAELEEKHQLQKQEHALKQKQLETELVQMQQIHDSLNDKHQILQSTLDKMSQDLQDRQENISSLEVSRTSLEDNKKKLADELEELERLLNESQDHSDDLQKRLSETLASLTVLKITHDQLLKQTASQNDAVAGQEAQRVQLAELLEERDRLAGEVDDLQSQLESAITKNESLTQLLKDAAEEKTLLSADIGQLEEELNNVHRTHASEKTIAADLRKELDALEEENQDLLEQIELCKQDNDGLNQTLIETLDTHDATLKKLEALELSFEELTQGSDTAKGQHEITMKRVESLEHALEEATAEKSRLTLAHQHKLDKAMAESEALKQAHAKLLTENDTKLHSQFELEKNTLSSQFEQNHKIKVDDLLASHDKLSSQLQKQIYDLELELTAAKNELVEQSKKLVSLEKSNLVKIDQLQSDVGLLTQANREKEAQLESSKHQLETMTRTIDSLEKVKASADFAAQIQSTTTDSDHLYQERIRSLEESLKKAEEENLEYASLSEELEKEVRRITQEMGAMSEELDANEETVIQYEGKLTEINQYVTQNKGSYDELPMKVKELMEAAASQSDRLGKGDQSSVNDIPSKVGGGPSPLPDPIITAGGGDDDNSKKLKALEQDLRNCQIKLKEAADSQQAKEQAMLDQKKEFTSLLAAEKQKTEKAERARLALEKRLDELLNKKKGFMCF